MVRATVGGSQSQTVTFSVALPSDETLNSLALTPAARGGTSAATQERTGRLQVSRRIVRCC